jgi:hypothetical protein
MDHLILKAAPFARLVLGLIFFVFGLNGFLQFMPMPPVPEAAGAFLGALAASGYMFPLIKATEVGAGILLLSNRYVPLALLLLAPVVVNILAFHLVLAPEGLALALVSAGLLGVVAWSQRAAFAGVLQARTAVGSSRGASTPEHKAQTSVT